MKERRFLGGEELAKRIQEYFEKNALPVLRKYEEWRRESKKQPGPKSRELFPEPQHLFIDECD